MVNTYKRIPPDELYHHGVKGMKWGVRRATSKTGSKHRIFMTRRQKDKLRRTQLQDELSKMSDTELRNRINRLGMEKQYEQLTAPKPNPNSVGEVTKKMFVDATKELGKEYIKKYEKQTIDSIINRTASYDYTSLINRHRK